MLDKYAIPGLKTKSKRRPFRRGRPAIPKEDGARWTTAGYVRAFDRMNSLVPGGTVIGGVRI